MKRPDLIQVVTRGNFFSNFQTVDIAEDHIEITCYGMSDYRQIKADS